MSLLWFSSLFIAPALLLGVALLRSANLGQQKRKWPLVVFVVLSITLYSLLWQQLRVLPNLSNVSFLFLYHQLLSSNLFHSLVFLWQPLIVGLGALYTIQFLSKKNALASSPYNPKGYERLIFVLLMALLIVPTIYSYLFLNPIHPWSDFFRIWIGWVPILLFQWSIGYRVLLRMKTPLLGCFLPMTFYFWFVDTLSRKEQIPFFTTHNISSKVFFGNSLPLENALYFVLVNLITIQSFILIEELSIKELPLKLGGRPFSSSTF